MTPDAIERAAAELAIAMLRFESGAAHPPRGHRPPGAPEPGVDVYHLLPDWTAIPVGELADRFMATPSPLLLFPTPSRGSVALLLLDELGPERRKWAEHSIANWVRSLDELAARHGLADAAVVTLAVGPEPLRVPLAAVRRCFARYMVCTGWTLDVSPDGAGDAQLVLIGSGGLETPRLAGSCAPPPPLEAAGEILWRRVDLEGHDGCRLERRGDVLHINGTALSREASGPMRLTYRILAADGFRRQRADVRGRIGDRHVEYHIRRRGDDEGWTLNDTPVSGLDDCADVDLGFTPATNTLTLRRLDLVIGQRAELAVAWLDVEAGTLTRLPQTYERLDAARYAYTSPTVGYAETLEVDGNGLVTHYPGLWRVVT